MKVGSPKTMLSGGVNRSTSKATRAGQMTSLPTTMISDLNDTRDMLLFDHRMKDASLSSVVELAVKELYENNSPEQIAKKVKQLCR